MERESGNEEWLRARMAMTISGLSTALEDAEGLGVDDEVIDEIETAREAARAALHQLEGE